MNTPNRTNKRERQYEPDFGIEGPHPPPIVIPWWVLPIVLFVICAAAGAAVHFFHGATQ